MLINEADQTNVHCAIIGITVSMLWLSWYTDDGLWTKIYYNTEHKWVLNISAFILNISKCDAIDRPSHSKLYVKSSL